MKQLLVLILLFLTTASFSVGESADDILGVWKDPEGKGHMQIFKQNGKYYGKVIWLKNGKDANGKPKLDRKNPDPALRTRPVVGLVMLRDFKYDNGEWTQGYIYNPTDGKEYKAYMKLHNKDQLSVRGYVGISLLGKTMTWERVRS